jgi:hypothetical protein
MVCQARSLLGLRVRGSWHAEPTFRRPRLVHSGNEGALLGGSDVGWRDGAASSRRQDLAMAVIDDVRPLGSELERSYEVYVRGRLKFRVGQIVYVAFSLDERVMEFAFPKVERAALVAGEPHKFHLPSASDMRFNWVHADLAAVDPTEARELVVDAWRMVVPQKLSRAYDLAHPDGPG